MTAGPMRVGWAHADCSPGCQLGSDEDSWAFDGYNVSTSWMHVSEVIISNYTYLALFTNTRAISI